LITVVMRVEGGWGILVRGAKEKVEAGETDDNQV